MINYDVIYFGVIYYCVRNYGPISYTIISNIMT